MFQISVDVLKREAYENINSFVTVDSGDFADPSPGSSLSLQDDKINMDFDTKEVFGSLNTWRKYDVIIRCKKGDISYDNFTSYLRVALCRRGISVYEDSNEVYAVPECRILIILLTSTYIPSNLLDILVYQHTEHLVVYPIFIGLSPYDFINNNPRWLQAALMKITQMPGYTLTDKYVIHGF